MRTGKALLVNEGPESASLYVIRTKSDVFERSSTCSICLWKDIILWPYKPTGHPYEWTITSRDSGDDRHHQGGRAFFTCLPFLLSWKLKVGLCTVLRANRGSASCS
jgi:hypothetical protein